MKEKNIQTEFGKRNSIIGMFELKLCKGTSLPFSALAEHQEQALLDVSSDIGLYEKISDFPVFAGSKARFNRKKPFDAFFLKNIPAYVVLAFYVPRKKKLLYYIPIANFVKMREESVRKSITEEMAKTYTAHIVDYGALGKKAHALQP